MKTYQESADQNFEMGRMVGKRESLLHVLRILSEMKEEVDNE